MAAFARGPGGAARIILCPAGRSVTKDLAFLREARRRILWPGPPWLLRDAVAGLLNLPDAPAGDTPRGPRAAILLEGTVDSRRAERVLAIRGPRLWILSDVQSARLSGRRLESLERRGVRLCALRPVGVEAIVVSPALAAARRRWRKWVPDRTPIHLLEPPKLRPSPARSRRSSRR